MPMEGWDRTQEGGGGQEVQVSEGARRSERGLRFRALHKVVPGLRDSGSIWVPRLSKEAPAVTLLCVSFGAKR